MGYHRSTDTIAAIATPPGTGGIGIIRISGPFALSILQRVFTAKYPTPHFESHRMYYGTIRDHEGQLLDEGLAVFMKGPATYTVEDVVELQCHGSYLLLQRILQLVFRCGARPAEAGEFTKRAFLGGRIDLAQAEAVIDLLQAQTGQGVSLAVNQLQGELSSQVEGIRKELVGILALLEVAIDFPDDDIEEFDTEQINVQLENQVLAPLRRLINAANRGKVIREGVSVVIAGRPNVGKSSLLNTLLREDRALVTSLPGTTRDTIEETIAIRGIPVHLVDTAGIRAHNDVVEELGMERAWQKMQSADLILFLVDASEALTDRDEQLYTSIQQIPHIVVLNKTDTSPPSSLSALTSRFSTSTRVMISAKEQRGIRELEEAIFSQVTGGGKIEEVGLCAPNLRHLTALDKTVEACVRLQQAITAAAPCDLLAVETQDALDFLGDIVGLTTPDDVLDTIFNEFCIGK